MRKLMIRFATASDEERERIPQLQAEQAARDEERAKREIQQAARDEQRAKRERWQTVLQVVQLVAIAAAVAAVFISIAAINQGAENLRQQREAAARQDQHSRYSSISELNLDLQKTIAGQPQLLCSFWAKLKLCDAKPRLNAQDRLEARVLASYKLDTYGYLYAQLENLGAAPDSGEFILQRDPNWTDEQKSKYEGWVTWSQTMVDAFENSPIMCEALIDSAGAYEEKFVHAITSSKVCPGL